MDIQHPHTISSDWWNLYCSAFPAEERRSNITHGNALKDKRFHACQLVEGPQFVGLLTWWQWPDMIYVEHLAIEEAMRGKGYGKRALQQLQELSRDIVLEIEPVRDSLTQRRLRFYQSCGFAALPYPHTQLAYQHGYRDIPLTLLGWSPSKESIDTDKWQLFEMRFAAAPMQYRDR